jgi:hypothetical protein
MCTAKKRKSALPGRAERLGPQWDRAHDSEQQKKVERGHQQSSSNRAAEDKACSDRRERERPQKKSRNIVLPAPRARMGPKCAEQNREAQSAGYGGRVTPGIPGASSRPLDHAAPPSVKENALVAPPNQTNWARSGGPTGQGESPGGTGTPPVAAHPPHGTRPTAPGARSARNRHRPE